MTRSVHSAACSIRNVLLGTLLLVTALVSAVANAQDARTPLRIGFVLPPADAGDPLDAAVARNLRQGMQMGIDEFGFNAEMLGIDLVVEGLEARTPEEAQRAFRTLVDEHEVAMVIGALQTEGIASLRDASVAAGVPLLNLGSSADRLRNQECAATLFHLEPSAGMYLDALAGWYVRAGFRRWFFVAGPDEESQAQLERVRWSLRERHFGARDVGTVGADAPEDEIADRVQRANADVVLLLAPTRDQLRLLRAMEERGLDVEVTGYPYPEAQTRAFMAASADASPRLGTGRRATAWEPTLDAYGARELNARYEARFGEPMEAPAWAAFQAIKIVFEASALGGATTPDDFVAYFRNPQSVFDLWKGIGVTFRPWNQQLRQPLYLVKVVPDAESARGRGLLVGELPAIYMPQTDPLERLDQLGDLANSTECGLR